MSSVAVVILNWNGRGFLEKFLSGVITNSEPLARVVVVDNGSTDDSVHWMQTHYADIELIVLDRNYGFTGGYNRSLKQIDADYYVLLNSDIQVTPGWLQPLIELMDSDRTIAAVQPKVLSYSHQQYFEYAGASGGFIDTIGYPFCRGRLIGSCEQDQGQYDTVREIFWATGAAFMVRADLYHSSGGLDDNFFAHQEEIDLCWRLKRQGYKIMVCPKSVIYHVGAGTLPVWSPLKTYLNFRNNIAMLYKNLTLLRFVIVYLVRFGTDFLRFLSYIFTIRFAFAAAIFRGHRDFWRMRSRLDRHCEYGFGRVGQIYRSSIVLHYIFVSKNFKKLL